MTHCIIGEKLAPGLPKECRVCKTEPAAPAKLQQCSRCKVAVYCGEKCQSVDWSKHRTGCDAAMRAQKEIADSKTSGVQYTTPDYAGTSDATRWFVGARKAYKQQKLALPSRFAMFVCHKNSAMAQRLASPPFSDALGKPLAFDDGNDRVYMLSMQQGISVCALSVKLQGGMDLEAFASDKPDWSAIVRFTEDGVVTMLGIAAAPSIINANA